jgi:hypothetical protein
MHGSGGTGTSGPPLSGASPELEDELDDDVSPEDEDVLLSPELV